MIDVPFISVHIADSTWATTLVTTTWFNALGRFATECSDNTRRYKCRYDQTDQLQKINLLDLVKTIPSDEVFNNR